MKWRDTGEEDCEGRAEWERFDFKIKMTGPPRLKFTVTIIAIITYRIPAVEGGELFRTVKIMNALSLGSRPFCWCHNGQKSLSINEWAIERQAVNLCILSI